MAPHRSRPAHVTVAESSALDAEAAVREVTARITPADTCFVIAFVPQHLDLDALAGALSRALSGVPVFGCTTAGQITAQGYTTESLLLIGFPKENFRCASILVAPLKPLSIKTTASIAQKLSAQFRPTAGWNRLALLLADGLSKQEDLLVSTLETALGDLPIFGGSAGDGLAFARTHVLHGGKFHTNAALLLLLETDLHFQGIGFDHFLPTERQMVITDARPEERLVLEINGSPAAPEYARLVGCPVDQLSPEIFAENPMLVRQNANYYVRAISDTTAGLGLSFMAAIDDGLILNLGRGKEIIETLEAGLDLHGPSGDAPDFILGFDCVLRKLEIEQKQLSHEVSAIFRDRRVYGFNTYGEQHRGVHVNQSFVGVAFFDRQPRDLH